MKILGKLDLGANQLQNFSLEPVTEFPADSTAGRLIFKDKRVLFCAEIVSGIKVWIPLTKEIDSHVHTHTVSEATWTIIHELNTSLVMVQVYDNNGLWVVPTSIDTSIKNQVTVVLPSAMTGHAVLMLGTSFGYGKTNVGYEEEFTNTDTIVVAHALGYNPLIRVYVDGQEIQPLSVVHDNTMQTTITLGSALSGTVVAI